MKFLFTCFVIFIFFLQSFSQSNITHYTDALRLIDNWVAAKRDYADMPSVSVAIVKDQQTIWSKAYGMANKENKVAAATSTVYSICSISKLFTSIAIMQLYDAGKLRLDDSIQTILPNYNLKQQYNGSGPVTIRSLLTHSSGLPREADYPYWTGPDFPFPSQAQMNARLGEQQTLYPSATYFQYSNLGMALLGEVVEKISGKAYDTYVAEHILAPLRLTATHSFLPKEEWGKKMAIGYGSTPRVGARSKINLFDAKGIKAAAGFSSTVEDLASFASWQFRLLNNGGTEILKSSTLKEMHRVQWLDPDWEISWGLGFRVSRQDGTTLIGHGGSCPGYRTTLQLDPKEKMAYTVMINAGGESPELIVTGMRKILAKIPANTFTKNSSLNLEQYAGTYTSQPWGSEKVVVPWYGDLVVMNLPNENPTEAMMTIQHVAGDIFRRVRQDKTLGEEIIFDKDAAGKVTRMLQHNNYSIKVAGEK